MRETNRSGWPAFFFGVNLLVVAAMPLAPLLRRWEILDVMGAFAMLGAVAIGAVVMLVAGVVAVFSTRRRGDRATGTLIAWATLLPLVPIVVLSLQFVRSISVPPIHDISTDPLDPPGFTAAAALREPSDNPLTYGDDQHDARQLARLQREAYPEIRPLQTRMSSEEAFSAALAVLEEQGLEIVHEDEARGMIEAVATTFWFGFKDDLVVRVTSGVDGAVIDLRSVSRVGRSDLGANAARINAFVEAFRAD